MKHLLFAVVLAGATLAACSGWGGGTSPTPVTTATAAALPAQTPGVAGPQNGARGTISMTIPATSQPATSSSTRKTSFVSPGSMSVGVTVNGSTGMYDVSPGSTYCTTTAGVRSCQLPIGVTIGTTNVNVSISVYSAANGTGSVLGGGAGSATMSPTATTFGPIVVDVNPSVATVTATITFANGFPRFLYGSNEQGTLNPTYMDASNNVIPSTSTSPFLTPVTLSANDPSVVFTSSNVVTNAAQAIQVSYPGTLCSCPNITIAAATGTTTVGTLAVKMSGYPTAFSLAGGAAANPRGIAAGPDGNIWFVEQNANKIGRILVAAPNTITEFTVPTGSSFPQEIANGPAGFNQLWFGETSGNKIASITTSGVIGEHNVTGNTPESLVAVGNIMWTAMSGSNEVYRSDTNGTPAPAPSGLPSSAPAPVGITLGPDNNVWVTGDGNGQIYVYNPATLGIIATYPAPGGGTSQPLMITSGTDGALWFTERNGAIGRLTTTGVGSNFPIPGPSSDPFAITSFPATPPIADNGIWFTMNATGAVGRIDPTTHTIFQYANSGTARLGIVAGPDGNIWFTDSTNGTIVRMQP